MGATLWQHEAAWQSDVGQALLTLQVEQFNHRYNFTRELETLASDTKAALQAELNTGDRFGLAAIWSKQLQLISEAIARPVPYSTLDQIEVLRGLLPEGFASVLDVIGVDSDGGLHVMRVLTTGELAALYGTEKPHRALVEPRLHTLISQLDRGESAAFPIYDMNGQPIVWMFIGYTVD